MHKRTSWIFVLFAILIIAGVVSCLIFWPKNDNKHPEKPDEIIKDGNGSGNNKDDENENDMIYATSLVVNLPNNINILVGTEVKLLSSYIQVQPAEMLSSVIIKITPQNQSYSNGLKFENEILKAIIIGNYNIEFSVAKSATDNLTKSLGVVVHDDSNLSLVKQKQRSLIKSEPTNIFNLFDFNSTNYQVICDDKTNFTDGNITASKIGITNITISFSENYLQYIYKFNFTIKEQPLYSIVLTNVSNNTLEIDLSNPTKFIYFQIKNRNEEYVNQFVVPKIEDENLVNIQTVTDLYIKIKAEQVGTTNLTIVCEADEASFVTIQIIVK